MAVAIIQIFFGGVMIADVQACVFNIRSQPIHCWSPNGKKSLPPPLILMTDTAEPNSSLSEAEQFLKTLDLPNDNDTNVDANGTHGEAAAANASDIMSFLDEITNTTSHYEASETDNSQKESAPIISDSWRQWGTSIWNQANEVVKTTSEHINQATSNPDTAAKALQERVGGWQAFISSNNVAKLGKYRMIFFF